MVIGRVRDQDRWAMVNEDIVGLSRTTSEPVVGWKTSSKRIRALQIECLRHRYNPPHQTTVFALRRMAVA